MKAISILSMILILSSFKGHGQNISTAEIMATIQLGDQCYYIIHEDGTENYYKTSPHPSSSLIQGQEVQLEFDTYGNENTIQVIAPEITEPLYCELINQNSNYSAMMPLLRGIDIGYRKHVGYNSKHNILIFQTWNDVRIIELLLEENVKNYTYNQGNEETIFNVIHHIRSNGWNMSNNQNGNKVSLPIFSDFLAKCYPLSSEVLIDLIELDEEVGLNPIFMLDVFIQNLPLSNNTEEYLINSNLAPGIKNQILDENDSFLDAPNHAYLDFIETFPGFYSLYEKLNNEEIVKLQSGMDPSDPNFDTDPVLLPFERLIMNDKHEVWIQGRLYKIYEDCRAISMQGNVEDAYSDLSVLNPDGSPNIPQINEGPEGLSTEIMEGFVPSEYLIYNPQQFDPLGSNIDDPNYNTALQTYNLITGCPISNYTYSLYSTSDLSVNFYNMTDFTDVVLPENSFYHYWTFGDGTGSFQNNPIHIYSDYGVYTVRLTTFNSDCGCWHVHTHQIEIKPPQLREGNPDCPFHEITTITNWNQDPLAVNITASPNVDDAIPPNTSVINYNFAFYTSNGTLVYEEDRGPLDFIFYDFDEEGQYYVIVTATWDGGCVSESEQHDFTLNSPEDTPECCDKKSREKENDLEVTYNDNKYKLKYKDVARGTFGTSSWRKIQGTQKLYVKKKNKILWKKQPAWHILLVNGTYWDREQDDTDNQWYCFNPQVFDKAHYTCQDEVFQLESHPGNFPNKFGLDEESITIVHKVYLGGSMVDLPATSHCCDCSNTGGHLLFNFEVKLGDCDD